MLRDHIANQSPGRHYTSPSAEHRKDPRNCAVLRRGCHGDDWFPTFGTQSTAQEVHLAANAAVKLRLKRTKPFAPVWSKRSLNGATLGGWTQHAKQIEQAGADAIECNIYFIPTDTKVSGSEVEMTYIDILRAIRANPKMQSGCGSRPKTTRKRDSSLCTARSFRSIRNGSTACGIPPIPAREALSLKIRKDCAIRAF